MYFSLLVLTSAVMSTTPHCMRINRYTVKKKIVHFVSGGVIYDLCDWRYILGWPVTAQRVTLDHQLKLDEENRRRHTPGLKGPPCCCRSQTTKSTESTVQWSKTVTAMTVTQPTERKSLATLTPEGSTSLGSFSKIIDHCFWSVWTMVWENHQTQWFHEDCYGCCSDLILSSVPILSWITN